MKTYKYIFLLLTALGMGTMTSCEDFLETMPDQRTTLNSTQKVKDLLVSAYPEFTPMLMWDTMADDRMDGGDKYPMPNFTVMTASYHWQEINDTNWDSPASVWDACYIAIAAANQALKAIEELGNPADAQPYKGEALMCRAYCHFILVNTFCMAYGDKAAQHLGIPYVEKPETIVGQKYVRGTLEDTYAKINRDIEEGLPLIRTDAYDVPLYHFNERAAYAFATRFNVFYRKYENAIKYSLRAIGENPTLLLRDLLKYHPVISNKNAYTLLSISQDEPANLMLLATYSTWGRCYFGELRFAHNRTIAYELTFRSKGPWGVELGAYAKAMTYADLSVFLPKLNELFHQTNVLANTGLPRIVAFAFTADETLLCRAEAYVMTGQYENAFQSLAYWYRSKQPTKMPSSLEEVSDYYQKLDPKTNGMPLYPDFDIQQGMQTNLLKAVLHARRIETVHEGARWLDVKRFGIEVTHNLYNAPSIVLKPQDLRTAIQLPPDVITAGMEKNPR